MNVRIPRSMALGIAHWPRGGAALLLGLVACASPGAAAEIEPETDTAVEGSTGAGTGVEEPPADEGLGHCVYTSPFTRSDECREYTGSGWVAADVEAACDALMGSATLGSWCDTADMLGRCVLDAGTPSEVRVVTYGTDPQACSNQQLGCETFGGGTWEPAEICEGAAPGSGGGGNESPFIQPTLECRAPLPGEPPGQSAGGEVCTWQMISGATEFGRRFEDYADCEVVYTQRPYAALPPHEPTGDPDPRLDDADYVAELAWVKQQVQATACTCCHSDVAPNGTSNWNIDAPGNWASTFYDSGLAMAAGWVDSTAFGAYPPEDNNGFERAFGIPSTDPERMRAFFEAELAHRGLTEADFADTPPFGGPLHTQRLYEPGRCENGEGVAADGTVRWSGGPARYVYVLEAGSDNPTVPPNLDLPSGTLWRLDVPPDEAPLESGSIGYAQTPARMEQRFPPQGSPSPLVPGQDYYLYVTRDVIVPLTRCVFTF